FKIFTSHCVVRFNALTLSMSPFLPESEVRKSDRAPQRGPRKHAPRQSNANARGIPCFSCIVASPHVSPASGLCSLLSCITPPHVQKHRPPMLSLHTTLRASMTAAVYWPMPVETPALVCAVQGTTP